MFFYIELNPSHGSKEILPVWYPIRSSDPLPLWLTPENASRKYTELVILWKKGLLQMENKDYSNGYNTMKKIIEFIDEISEFAKELTLELFEVLVLIHMSLLANGMSDFFKQKECLLKADNLLKKQNMTDPNVAKFWGIVNYEIASKACEMNFKSNLVHAVRFLRFALFGPGQALDKDEIGSYSDFFWNNIALGCYFIGKLTKNDDLSDECFKMCKAAAKLVNNTKILAELSLDLTQENELELIMSGNFRNPHMKQPSDVPIKDVSNVPIVSNTSPRSNLDSPASECPVFQTRFFTPSKMITKNKKSNNSISDLCASLHPRVQDESEAASGYGNTRKQINVHHVNIDDTSDTDEDDDDEDWDKEFGFETKLEVNEISTQNHRQLLKIKDVSAYKMSEKASVRNMQVVTFPIPSRLYSLKIRAGTNGANSNGMDSFQPQDFEIWLRTLVEVHLQEKRIFPASTPTGKVHEETKALKERLAKDKEYSLECILRAVTWCRFLAMKGENTLCWDMLGMLFDKLEEYVVTTVGMSSQSKAVRQMQRVFFDVAWEALIVSTWVWTTKYSPQFKRMVNIAKSLYPAYSYLIDIVQCELVCSDIMTRVWEEEVERSAQDEQEIPDVMSVYMEIYDRARSSLGTTQSKGPLFSLGNVLSDLYLITSSIPPLLFSRAPTKYMEDSEFISEQLHSKRAKETAERLEIYTQEQQIQAIQDVYPLIPCSPTKAKMAFAMGHYAASCNNNVLAESLLFESIYIFETYTNGIPGLLSDMGLRTLQLFAEVLRANHKTVYAKAAYSSATLLCSLQDKKEYFTVAKDYAEVARESNDTDECVRVYEEIARKYAEKERLLEVVYVKNVIADLNVERGHFLEAEKALQDSVKIIEKFMAGNQSSQGWDTRLKLASVYLDGYTPERGIKYLEGIIKNAPAWVLKQRGHAVWSLLATGYSRNGQIQETLDALAKSLPQDASLVHNTDTRDATIMRYKKQFINAAFTLIRLYKGIRRPLEALTVCDAALEFCDPMADALTMARLYKRRADVLSMSYERSDILSFPTTLRAEIPGSPLPMPSESQTFMRPTDIFLEAAASYIRANGIFSAAGYTFGVSETLSHLSMLYVNRLLVPVAIFHEPLERLLRVPYYRTRACELNYKEEKGEYVLSLEEIEHITAKALNASIDVIGLIKFPEHMINAAELKLLQGDHAAAFSFWKECKDIIWGAFMDGTSLFITSWPGHDLRKVADIIERLTRFVVCMGDDFISKNFLMIDTFVKFRDTLYNIKNAGGTKYNEARSDYSDIDKDLLKLKFECGFPASGNSTQASQAGHSPSISHSPMSAPTTPAAAAAETSKYSDDNDTDGTFDYVDESTVKDVAYNNVAEFVWRNFVYLKKQHRKLDSEPECKEALVMNMKKAFFECFHAAAGLRAGVGSESSISPNGSCSPDKVDADSFQEMPINQRVRFDAFASKFPRIAQKIVYAVSFRSIIMFYSPWARLSYFVSLQSNRNSGRFCSRMSARSGSVEMRLCFLSNHDEYVIVRVSQDLTLEDLVSQICGMHNSGLFATLSSSSSSPNNSKEPSSTCRFRCLSMTKNFVKEINALSERLHREFLNKSAPSAASSSSSPPSSSSSSSSNRSYRIGERHILFAVKSQKPGAEEFTKLTRSYRAVTVGDVISENDIVDPQPTLYLYGSTTTQTQYTPYGKSQRYLSKGTIDYLSTLVLGSSESQKLFSESLLSSLSTSSVALVSQALSPTHVPSSLPLISTRSDPVSEAQKDTMIKELSTVFSGFLDLIPLKNKRKKRSSKSGGMTVESLMAEASRISAEENGLKRARASSSPSTAKGRSSPSSDIDANGNNGSGSSGNIKPNAKGEENGCRVPSVSRSPVIIICSRELQTIPWEFIVPASPVLRHFSFTDLVLSTNKTSWQTKVRFRPSYISICSKKYPDLELSSREDVRRNLIRGSFDYMFRNTFELPALSNKIPLPPFFTYPVPHKKNKLFYLRHRDMTFVSLSDLERNPSAFTRLIIDNFADSYPVIFITIADLSCPNPLLIEVLKRRASCTILAVPQDGLACVIDNMYHLYRPMCTIAASQKGKSLRNRYQFLLSTISLVMKRTSIPIAVINSPFPA